MDPSQTSPQSREQLDGLLREANVLRLRRQFGEAEDRCRQALEISPRDLDSLEMLGDLLYEKGNLAEARELFERSQEILPGRDEVETRLAKIILEQGERDHQRAMTQSLLMTSSAAERETKNRVILSALISLIFAGGGQVYNGEYVKAAILGGVYLLGWVVNGIPDLLRLIYLMMGGRGSGLDPDYGWRAAVGMVAVFAWVYSLLDAPKRARELTRPSSDHKLV